MIRCSLWNPSYKVGIGGTQWCWAKLCCLTAIGLCHFWRQVPWCNFFRAIHKRSYPFFEDYVLESFSIPSKGAFSQSLTQPVLKLNKGRVLHEDTSILKFLLIGVQQGFELLGATLEYCKWWALTLSAVQIVPVKCHADTFFQIYYAVLLALLDLGKCYMWRKSLRDANVGANITTQWCSHLQSYLCFDLKMWWDYGTLESMKLFGSCCRSGVLNLKHWCGLGPFFFDKRGLGPWSSLSN